MSQLKIDNTFDFLTKAVFPNAFAIFRSGFINFSLTAFSFFDAPFIMRAGERGENSGGKYKQSEKMQ